MSVRASHRWLLIFLSVACAVPLVIVAVGSLHSRYIADDYCLKMAAGAGWLPFVVSMYTGWIGTFSGLTLQGIMPNVEWLAVPIVLILALWAVLLYFAVKILLERFTLMQSNIRLCAALVVCLLLAAFLCSLPSLHQALFWYTAMIPYTFPLVLSLLYIPLVARSKLVGAYPLLFGLSFILAGFAPGFTALQVFLLCLFMLFLGQQTMRLRLLVSLFGALLGFAVVLVAPGNAVRTSVLGIQPDLTFAITMLPEVVRYPFLLFFRQSPFVILTVFALPAILAYYFGNAPTRKVVLIATVLFITFSGIGAAFAPSLYTLSGLLPSRTWTVPVWIAICGTAALGYAYGLLMRKDQTPLGYLPHRMQFAAAIFTIGFLLNGTPVTLNAVNRQAAYAAAWDARDAYLKTQAGSTETIRARSFHGTFDLEDLTGDPNYWTNACIARYYNLPAILPDDQPPFVP